MTEVRFRPDLLRGPLGAAIPRTDSAEKLTGRAEYVADLRFAGLLTGRVLRSPHASALIRRIDTSRAARLPGVRAVVTAADTPRVPWGTFFKDQPVLADERVRYVGEEVAAVAAIDADTAAAALELIEVEYEPLPAVLDAAAALAEGAPAVHADHPDNVAIEMNIVHGDVDPGFAQAAVVVEETFDTARQYHAYIEPIGSVAVPHDAGRLTVYMNSWSPFMSRDEMAAAIGVSLGGLRVVQPVVGGSFGGKVCDDNNALVCAVLARAAGRPVRLINSREEEFLGSRPREASSVTLRLGFAADGAILAKEAHVLQDNGAYTGKSPAVLGVTMKRCDYLYRMTNVRAHGRLVYTNTIPSGSMRGFGNPESVFALESILDMGADALGIDPIDLRLRNAARPGDVSVHGTRFASCGYVDALQRVREMSDWNARRARSGRPVTPGGRRVRGIGLGAVCHVAGKRHFGNWDGATVVATLDLDGTVVLSTGVGDTGSGSDMVIPQMFAATLGLPADAVRVAAADTATAPYNHGTHASRTTYIAGNAVHVAAESVREQVLRVAADLLEADPADLTIDEGVVSVRGSAAPGVSMAQVAQAALYKPGGTTIVGLGTWDPPTEITAVNQYGNESGAYSFGVQAAEVEVDLDTGEVDVLHVWSAVDAGTVINRLLADGQVCGGLQNGLGYVLSEDPHLDAGAPVERNFDNYKVLAAADMPRLRHEWIEQPEPTNTFGAKGLGELVVAPIGPAVANAVARAIGTRVCKLPLSGEPVWAALAERGDR